MMTSVICNDFVPPTNILSAVEQIKLVCRKGSNWSA